MRMIYLIHIVGGALSLGAGYLALYSTKGAPLHRRSGMVFVYAMLTMCAFGAILAIAHGEWAEVNVSAGVLTAYLVVTSLITVRPPERRVSRWLDPSLMVVALTVGLTCLTFGMEAVVGGGTRNGIPAFPFFMFGVVGTLAGLSDIRILRAGALQGARRLARHLWRMSFALFIAAMSFFIGQAKVIPEPIRIMPLLSMPVLAVLVTMVYWLWRVRFRKTARELAGFRAQQVAR
jgi:uncharacterized membrane protein